MESYGSNEDLAAWLTSMGFTLPEGSTTEGVRALGSMLIDATYGNMLSGQVANVEQTREFPRVGAYRGLTPVPSDLIPNAYVLASYFMGYYGASNPGAFFVGGSLAELVKRETIGPITTEYAVSSNMTADQIKAAMGVVLPFVEGLVGPFLKDNASTKLMILSVG